MYFECPQCGKLIDMSVDELAKSHLVVVCPQCLTEFQARGVTLPPVRPPSEADSGAAAVSLPQGHYAYCFSCGSSLPRGDLRFCPFCGVSLAKADVPAAVEADEPAVPANPLKEPITPEEAASNDDHAVIEDDAGDIMARLPVIWPIVPRISRRAAMGSTTTRVACYIVITLLLAVFFYLIYLINADTIKEFTSTQ